MLEVIRGKTEYPTQVQQLEGALLSMHLTGTFYIGYPILASADESTLVEGLLITEEHGLVVFSFDTPSRSEDSEATGRRIQDQQDNLYCSLNSNLSRHMSLRKGRGLGFEINLITFMPTGIECTAFPDRVVVADQSNVCERIDALDSIDKTYYRALNAALQRVTTIKPAKKRHSVKRQNSKGGILKQIEKEIANLDQWQKKGAIEQPEGIQRIRGLAGSGKTIALALKAAYLHSQYPDWDIAVVFHTRSLYQQFIDLIRRFTFEHSNDEPNLAKLRILHAWGSSRKMGAYAEMAQHVNVPPRDYRYGHGTYGMKDAFSGVCRELYSAVKNTSPEPIYDAVLIDEAQDLPNSFFQLVDFFTKEPKRIVFAYDELQSLTEATTIGVADFLSENIPEESNGEPMRDIVLPVCYRNTPWALALAHALGLGIYKGGLPVQFFQDPSVLQDVGYEVVSGKLELGSRVTIRRSETSYPGYFNTLIKKDEAVGFQCFGDEHEQANAVAESILDNLTKEELECDDILVIFPDAMRAKNQARLVMEALDRFEIPSHVVGVTSSQDIVFEENSVALANIYRAKGNEAPMVYILNSQYCHEGLEQIRKRNILFTAITRAKAWVNIWGHGESMEALCEEIRKVAEHDYALDFSIPTPDQLNELRRIHRDLTPREKTRIRKAQTGLKQFIEAIETGVMDIETLPIEQKRALKDILKRSHEDIEF